MYDDTECYWPGPTIIPKTKGTRGSGFQQKKGNYFETLASD